MSKAVLAWILFLFLLSSSGCMLSEQEGQDREDLTFRFDTGFNRMVLFARSGALAVVVLFRHRERHWFRANDAWREAATRLIGQQR